MEQGGSVKNYYTEDSIVKARRYVYEYYENGRPTEEYIKIKNLQKGALDFISNISHDTLLNQWNYSADELFSNLRDYGANPNKYIVDLFGDFRFYDEGVTSKLAAPRFIGYYLFHLNTLKKDFFDSKWKTGFMKRLLRINLPYEKIFYTLYKFK